MNSGAKLNLLGCAMKCHLKKIGKLRDRGLRRRFFSGRSMPMMHCFRRTCRSTSGTLNALLAGTSENTSTNSPRAGAANGNTDSGSPRAACRLPPAAKPGRSGVGSAGDI